MVNARPLDEFFGRETSRMVVRQPLEAVDLTDKLDLKITVRGGGSSGKPAPFVTELRRALVEYDENFRQPMRQAVFLPGTQEPLSVRKLSAQSTQAATVLQALISRVSRPFVGQLWDGATTVVVFSPFGKGRSRGSAKSDEIKC